MYNIESEKQIIIKVSEKLGASIAATERHFNIPKNILHNTRLNNVPIPKVHKMKLLTFLMSEDESKTDKWSKVSVTQILKGRFPKWLIRLKNYCKSNQITVDELIEIHKKINSHL